jgi:hypothetical protein
MLQALVGGSRDLMLSCGKEGVLMKSWLRLSLVMSAAVLLLTATGCTYYTSGYLGHEISTTVQLSQANFSVVKTATGSATADYLFGIGLSEQDLIGRATREMLRSAGLTGAQAVINVASDVKEMGFWVWNQKRAYVSAQVIEFTK